MYVCVCVYVRTYVHTYIHAYLCVSACVHIGSLFTRYRLHCQYIVILCSVIYKSQNTLQVLYYGLIKQSTGKNWTHAKLSLSTANPSIGGSVPKLGMQLLKFK